MVKKSRYLDKEHTFKDEKSYQNFIHLIKHFERFHKCILDKKGAVGDLINSNITPDIKIIPIFSFLEVIFSVYIIYTFKKVKDEKTFNNFINSKDFSYKINLKKFINDYVLNNKNNIYKKNNFLHRLDGMKMLELRNSLSHFLASSNNMAIANNSTSIKKTEKVMGQKGNGKLMTISPEILFELVNTSFSLLMNEFIKKGFSKEKKERKENRKRLDVVQDIFEKKCSSYFEFDIK